MKQILFILALALFTACEVAQENDQTRYTLVVTFHLYSGETITRGYDITGKYPERAIFVDSYRSGEIHVHNNLPFIGYSIQTGIKASYADVKVVKL